MNVSLCECARIITSKIKIPLQSDAPYDNIRTIQYLCHFSLFVCKMQMLAGRFGAKGFRYCTGWKSNVENRDPKYRMRSHVQNRIE